MNFSALCPTTWKNVPRCVPQRGIFFHVVSHNAEYSSTLYPTTRNKAKGFKNSSTLYPTTRNILPRCIPQRGRFFRVVSPTWKNSSALWDTMWNNIPRCVPKSYLWKNCSAVCPTTRKLLRGVSHNAENCSTVCPTTRKIAPRCIPQRGIMQRGIMLRVVSHNAE